MLDGNDDASGICPLTARPEWLNDAFFVVSRRRDERSDLFENSRGNKGVFFQVSLLQLASIIHLALTASEAYSVNARSQS